MNGAFRWRVLALAVSLGIVCGVGNRALAQSEPATDLSTRIDSLEKQLADLKAHPPQLTPSEKVRDLRNLLWSSIDNDTSKDLDQIAHRYAALNTHPLRDTIANPNYKTSLSSSGDSRCWHKQ